MKQNESISVLVWYVSGCLLAVFTYFYGLDSQNIPKNGDEYPYEHIVRLTAASGELLPLQSQLENMRNTKPPLLFWQGIASTGWGLDWTLWKLRYPSVIYTLLTASLLLLLGHKLTGKLESGFIAALSFMSFFATYRFGRPFLTNPPEVFWTFLPFTILLYWKQAFASRFVIPLLLGVGIGIGFLYKSFALALPIALGLTGWYLHQRHYNVMTFLKQDAPKVAIALCVALAMFALWFVFDPDPQAVWKEFVVGENIGKFDPHGPGYLEKLLWGSSSIWSYTFAFATNPGLLAFPVVAMFYVAYKNRYRLSHEEQLLWMLVGVFFLSFSLPSQRSGRYLLDVMPAVAMLCALNWQQINRKAFVASLVLAGTVLAGIAYLAVRLQTEMTDVKMFTQIFWLLLTITGLLTLLAIALPKFTRPAVNVVMLLVMLCFAAFLKPMDGELGNFSMDARRYAQGKDVWVPCNFRAVDEGHRFILPGAEIHGYNENQNLTTDELAMRYSMFATRVPLNSEIQNGGCDSCKVIGQRLDIRSRHSQAELKEMFIEGKVFQYLFVREILMESAKAGRVTLTESLAQVCR